jgi:hypothetical protein
MHAANDDGDDNQRDEAYDGDGSEQEEAHRAAKMRRTASSGSRTAAANESLPRGLRTADWAEERARNVAALQHAKEARRAAAQTGGIAERRKQRLARLVWLSHVLWHVVVPALIDPDNRDNEDEQEECATALAPAVGVFLMNEEAFVRRAKRVVSARCCAGLVPRLAAVGEIEAMAIAFHRFVRTQGRWDGTGEEDVDEDGSMSHANAKCVGAVVKQMCLDRRCGVQRVDAFLDIVNGETGEEWVASWSVVRMCVTANRADVLLALAAKRRLPPSRAPAGEAWRARDLLEVVCECSTAETARAFFRECVPAGVTWKSTLVEMAVKQNRPDIAEAARTEIGIVADDLDIERIVRCLFKSEPARDEVGIFSDHLDEDGVMHALPPRELARLYRYRVVDWLNAKFGATPWVAWLKALPEDDMRGSIGSCPPAKVVACASLGCSVDLLDARDVLAKRLPGEWSVKHKPASLEKQRLTCARTRPSRLALRLGDLCQVFVFRSGTVVSFGERSGPEAERRIAELGRALRRSGYDASVHDFRIVHTWCKPTKPAASAAELWLSNPWTRARFCCE